MWRVPAMVMDLVASVLGSSVIGEEPRMKNLVPFLSEAKKGEERFIFFWSCVVCLRIS